LKLVFKQHVIKGGWLTNVAKPFLSPNH